MGNNNKKYDAFQLFEEIMEHVAAKSPFLSELIAPEKSKNAPPKKPAQKPTEKSRNAAGPEEGMYYEIEYDSGPLPGVGKFVLKSQKVHAPVKDEVRELFDRMRDIARDGRGQFFGRSKFYDKRTQQENSRIFYKQAVFMKDFEDAYDHPVPYAAYFPYYQMMGYEQLRTYFTWRTQVRRGNVTDTSLSYAYLYIYELLNNIGVEDAQEGLDKLMSFWRTFRAFDTSIDKYVLKWLKDYHIYYELPHTFQAFIAKNGLKAYYPEVSDEKSNFDMICTISKYDMRKSVFYTADREKLIKDCVDYTLDRLGKCFAQKGLQLEDFIYQPTKNLVIWTPFKEALFYPRLSQRDRRVVLSEKEVYLYSKKTWLYSTSVTNESGRQLLGYVLKQTEAVLRQAVKFKYKITAGTHTISPQTANRIAAAGIDLEKVVTAAVTAFYREATKTVVSVDPAALERIRQESLETQEKLIVPEEEAMVLPQRRPEEEAETVFSPQEAEVPPESDPWVGLRDALGQTGLTALGILLKGEKDLKAFADEQGIMLEVLTDEINEKAMDFVGDSLVDEEYAIYEDYTEQVRRMVE